VTLLAAQRISKKFDDQIIISDVSFTISNQEKIGLTGKNGSGKTTLFEMISGQLETDSGDISYSKTCKIDYITQEKTEHLDKTLYQFTSTARTDLLDMRQEINELEHYLQYSPNDSKAVEKLGVLHAKFENSGGFSFENELVHILEGLGFPRARHDEPIKNFSGGEKNRAGLALALAGNGTLLLLDEPTNHLDIESTQWLEEYLSKINKSYIIISHDRTFLNNTVNKVWEISFAKIDNYVGNFEKYLDERQKRLELQEHHYKHQQAEIKKIEDFIQRNMAGQKTKQAQSKLKYLARIKRIQPVKHDSKQANIKMESSGRSYAHVLSLGQVSLGYGSVPIVNDVSIDIYRGDKIGLIGKNGSGKTTILKSIIGEITPINGEIKLGSNVEVAYFDQELSDLNNKSTVIDSVWELDPIVESGKIRSFLARFGFYGEDAFKPVQSLSGGEKTKLSLARLLYYPANFIIFDEPTNHLDIDSRNILEKALVEYDGSALIVSHDRYFLDKVVTKILHLSNSFIKSYPGNYSYFKERTENLHIDTVKVKDESKKEAYLEFKEKSKQKSYLKRNIQQTKDKIEQLERELEIIIDELNNKIEQNNWEKLHKATDKKNELEDNIIKLYHELEKLEEINLD